MPITLHKTTKALIIVVGALVMITLMVTHFIYKSINESVDPRVVHARQLYEGYNELAQRNAFDSVYLLLDAIESEYHAYKHYRNSYEVGVLYNNRAASYLTVALYGDTTVLSLKIRDSLINLSETAAKKSIDIYEGWLLKYDKKTPDEISQIASSDFFIGLEGYDDNQKARFFKRRIKEIERAQQETKRRLSVSYTNLGIVCRHHQQYKMAAEYYKMAFDLWDENLVAENNLNILLNKPVRERSFIQKMFPPKR